jgi:AraC family transcriptional regulator
MPEYTSEQLLLGTDLSVTDICFEVGYNSLGTFTRILTDFVGLSPNQLRHFATRENISILRQLESWLDLVSVHASERPSLAGYLFGPPAFSGNVFVGLFRTRIPQGRPAAGTLIQELGLYKICDVPTGCITASPRLFLLHRSPLITYCHSNLLCSLRTDYDRLEL